MKKRLSQFRKRDLEEYTFPGTDAAVYHVPKKVSVKELNAVFDTLTGPERRYYPTSDGWDVKFPWWAVSEINKDKTFKRQKLGWDREQCSFCGGEISIGEKCHTHEHENGGVYIFCKQCCGKLKR
jgi:hypothetical protein